MDLRMDEQRIEEAAERALELSDELFEDALHDLKVLRERVRELEQSNGRKFDEGQQAFVQSVAVALGWSPNERYRMQDVYDEVVRLRKLEQRIEEQG